MRGGQSSFCCAAYIVFPILIELFTCPVMGAVQNGDLLVADTENGTGSGIIIDINPKTGQQTVVASAGYLVQPSAVCWDASSHTLIVADFGGVGNFDRNGAVFRIDPVTGQQTLISIGGLLNNPTAIEIDKSGELVVAQQDGLKLGQILRIDPVTGAQTLVSSGLPMFAVDGLAIDPKGNYLVSNYYSPTSGSGVLDINKISGAQTIVSSGGLINSGPEGICLDPTRAQDALVAQFGSSISALVDVNINTGGQSYISTGNFLTAPTDVTGDQFGNAYVTDQNGPSSGSGNVVKINLQTGAQTLISQGNDLRTPLAIAIVPEPACAPLMLALSTLLTICRPMNRRSRGENKQRQTER